MIKRKVSDRDNLLRKKYSQQSNQSASSLGDQQQQTPVGKKAASSGKSEKPGTVRSLSPNAPVILPQNATVVETARAMAGNRTDAILVVDSLQSMQLVGIVTDKDLAFRCVAENLDHFTTLLSSIMTPNPVSVASDATIDEAITIMLRGHFRHLPVLDNGLISGILDITRLIRTISAKISQSWGRAKTLKKAYRDFLDSWANLRGCDEVERWFSEWEDKMVEPDLSSVISAAHFPTVGFKTSVRDAVRAMKDYKQTAVLIVDSSASQTPNLSFNSSSSTSSSQQQKNDLAGIFTTKDLCLRVLAASSELDPKGVSVVRVMTPRPDAALDNWGLQEALKKMQNGHYLHLPVLSHVTGRIVGLVDLMQLTYSIIELIISHQSIQISSTSFSRAGSAIDEQSILNEEHKHAVKGQDLWTKFFNDADDAATVTGSVADESIFDEEPSFDMTNSPMMKRKSKALAEIEHFEKQLEVQQDAVPVEISTVKAQSLSKDINYVGIGGVALCAVLAGVAIGKLLK